MTTINLLPEDYIQRRCERRANIGCFILFGMVMVGVLSAALVSEQRLRNTRGVLEQVNQDYAKASKLIEQMHQLEAKKEEMHKKAELTASLLERIPRSTLLATITNARPKNVSLIEFKLTTAQVVRKRPSQTPGKGKSAKFNAAAKKSGSDKPEKELLVKTELVGHAETDVDVARFISNLSNSPLTMAVDLEYTKEKKLKDIPVREFKVVLWLRPRIDAIVVAKQARRKKNFIPSIFKAFLGAKS